MKYYDIERIYNMHPDYGIIVGGRSNGKSYSMAKKVVENYMKDGSQFARIVRYLFDIQGKYVADYFDSDSMINWLKETYGKEIFYESPYYYIKDIDAPIKTADILGHVMALSNEQKYKSNRYERVTNIIVEEFALLDPTQYLLQEAEKFMSICSTIVRMRKNVSVWLIGNTISKYNPYFSMLNVNIERLKITPGQLKIVPQPDIGYDEKPLVVIEFAEMAYEDMKEIPRLFKIGHNDTATSGLFMKPPDVFEITELKLDKVIETYIVQIGLIKFKLMVFPCFTYWCQCVGKEKTLKPDIFVKTMCYDRGRYYWNVIKSLKEPLPTETYYDTEETKQYVYENIIRSVVK